MLKGEFDMKKILIIVGSFRKNSFNTQLAKAVEKILENAMTRVAEFSTMGGIVAPGTDAGAWQVPHAVTSEYELLYQCGITDALLGQGIQAIQKKF